MQLMFCGHEYAVAAMTYVTHIDPTNQVAKDKLDWAKVRDTYQPVWMVYHAEGVGREGNIPNQKLCMRVTDQCADSTLESIVLVNISDSP